MDENEMDWMGEAKERDIQFLESRLRGELKDAKLAMERRHGYGD